MTFVILTLFPEIIDVYFKSSIMAKAIERGLISYRVINIRDYAQDKHHSCDDAPYGGGAGMLMLAEPLGRALQAVGATRKSETGDIIEETRPKVIYVSPGGLMFNQEAARKLALEKELVIICGRYEGIDQRIIDLYVDEEISIGDFVLSSGEVAALALIDAAYRLVSKVINEDSLVEESFSSGLLEYPQFTRPEVYDTIPVPAVLLSGHHAQIRQWRLQKQVEKTLAVRPDLIQTGLTRGRFDEETRKIIARMEKNE
ncbi:tRNA (guanosine(37)-N1)-methyltransferase TrmD [Breznakiellaceae bacterium SP9]